jgi:hypothetical protein
VVHHMLETLGELHISVVYPSSVLEPRACLKSNALSVSVCRASGGSHVCGGGDYIYIHIHIYTSYI